MSEVVVVCTVYTTLEIKISLLTHPAHRVHGRCISLRVIAMGWKLLVVTRT
jgi:hypothetical protein